MRRAFIAVRLGVLAVLLAGAADVAAQGLQVWAPPGWKDGWQLVSDQTNEASRRRIVYHPAKEENPPKRLLTIELVPGSSRRDAIARLLREWGAQAAEACPDFFALTGTPRPGNGYWVGYARFFCPTRSGSGDGSVDFVKVITAEAGAYLVAVTQRTASFTRTEQGTIAFRSQDDTGSLNEWLKGTEGFLESLRVCEVHGPLVRVCSP